MSNVEFNEEPRHRLTIKGAVVIGAGPAGLMAADVLSAAGHNVRVFDAMPSVGRKFLMAGKSGLNLSKDQDLEAVLAAYDPVSPGFVRAVKAFGPQEVMRWAQGLEQDIFTGSSGRIFPKAMKASPLLRAWLKRLRDQNVRIDTRWLWQGWGQDDRLLFQTPNGAYEVEADVCVLALGGASWARLGSTGQWAQSFEPNQIQPFTPSNMGVFMQWSSYMEAYFGQPLKMVEVSSGALRSKGEVMITQRGLEGGGLYEVSHAVQKGEALSVDLCPNWSETQIMSRWHKRRVKASLTRQLTSCFRLPAVKIALLQEVLARISTGFEPQLLKALPVAFKDVFPLDEAISTGGGVALDALNEDLALIERPGVFCAGEMLAWDAPTGGYLITGCLATGRLAGQSAAHHLKACVD